MKIKYLYVAVHHRGRGMSTIVGSACIRTNQQWDFEIGIWLRGQDKVVEQGERCSHCLNIYTHLDHLHITLPTPGQIINNDMVFGHLYSIALRLRQD